MKVITALVFMMLLAFGAIAQQKEGRHHRHHNKRHHRELVKDLNLSDAQKQQLKSLNEDFRKKMRELRKNENITVKEMRGQRATLAKEHKSGMESILTPDQKNKLQDRRSQVREKKNEIAGKRMEKMKTDLGLTDSQTSQLKAIDENFKNKAMSLRNNESLDRSAKKDQFKTLKQQHREDLKNILTKEQLDKLEEIRRTRGERRVVK